MFMDLAQLLIVFTSGKLRSWPAIMAGVQGSYTGHYDSTLAKAGVPVSFRQHCGEHVADTYFGCNIFYLFIL